jgi:general stress protein YciG
MAEKKKRGFAAMSKEQAQRIRSLGGKASPGNFKNDKERAKELAKAPRAQRRKRVQNEQT